jgi:hypothetical protein
MIWDDPWTAENIARPQWAPYVTIAKQFKVGPNVSFYYMCVPLMVKSFSGFGSIAVMEVPL